ncbi:hypothetical protein [Sphingomonas sp. PP-CE-1A-559]|uniref:hypothetical protein n=1 Tax=Sphingomonas sp. PP-CE-1A-559 TaxID=2135657 RepID=UPI001FB3D7DC|nr:hypothetical protein [Sphingomonas sp. PP-CE-1A-559]
MILFAAALLAGAPVALKPLFRDPVHDGAADPSTVYDAARREWVMFYTNRRACRWPTRRTCAGCMVPR